MAYLSNRQKKNNKGGLSSEHVSKQAKLYGILHRKLTDSLTLVLSLLHSLLGKTEHKIATFFTQNYHEIKCSVFQQVNKLMIKVSA